MSSVNEPDSLKPTYPGGEPIIFETEWTSENSDISYLKIAPSSPKSSVARAFASSVFPTPLSPINKKTPFGLSCELIPAKLLDTPPTRDFIALSCPKTRSLSLFSSSRESKLRFFVGIPVISVIVFSTSTLVTVSLLSFSGVSLYISLESSGYSGNSSPIALFSGGKVVDLTLTHASSRRSIALSGRNLSVKYLFDSLIAASIALSSIFKL